MHDFIHNFPVEDLEFARKSDAAQAAVALIQSNARLPKGWARLARAMSADGRHYTARDLLDIALKAFPAWSDARVARCQTAAVARDAAALRADVDLLQVSAPPVRIPETYLLILALLKDDLTAIKANLDVIVPRVLADPEKIPQDVILEACCRIGDIDHLKPLLDQKHRLAPV